MLKLVGADAVTEFWLNRHFHFFFAHQQVVTLGVKLIYITNLRSKLIKYVNY